MPTVTRKIQITPNGDKEEFDRVYRYLRNGMEVQAIMLNQCMSAVYTAKLNKASKEEIKEIYKKCSRIPSSSKGSYYDFDMKKFPTGLPIAGGIPMMVRQRLDKACKDGLMYGKVSLPTYRKDMPLEIHNDYVNIKGTAKGDKIRKNGFYHNYKNDYEFEQALSTKRTPDLHIRFANKITFDVILGDINRSIELRKTLAKCFSGEYQIGDSKIQIKNKKIFLLLSVKMPQEEAADLDEKNVVGVCFGVTKPVVCALNNDKYKHMDIGTKEEIVRKKTHIAAQRRSIQSAMKYNKGGHGRAKKLRKLEIWSHYERNFVKQYNHYMSANIIKFALENHAKYINIASVSDNTDEEERVIGRWANYELESMIKYKAQNNGIVVRKVKPEDTAQICSICGIFADTITEGTSFECSDPDCESHKLYYNKKFKQEVFNKDFNEARNIAMSENYCKEDNDEKADKGSEDKKVQDSGKQDNE